MSVIWDKISTGFDTSEETANFGTRAVALSDGCVYESNTLATIQPNEIVNIKNNPECQSIAYSNLVAVVIDESLSLFDKDFSNVLLNINFEDKVDEIDFFDDCNLIFIGLRNSALICVHVPSKTSFIISKCLNDINLQVVKNKFFQKIVSCCYGDALDLYVVDCGMRITKICGILIATMNECCALPPSTEKNELLDNIVNDLKVEHLLQPLNFGSNLVVTSYPNHNNKLEDFIFICGNKLKIFSISNGVEDIFPLDFECTIKKIAVTPCKRYCLGILESGAFFAICLETWTVSDVQENKIIDFVLLNNIEDNYFTSIITLEAAGEFSSLNLIRFPELHVIFSLRVGSTSFLVNNLCPDNDIIYIDGSGEPFINFFGVKSIVENLPELRLKRLLARGKFNDAEEFAKMFGLSKEDIYKSKAQRLCGDLQFWHKRDLEEDLALKFQELEELLEKIKDIRFVVELCQRAAFAYINWVQELYDYASTRLRMVQIEPELRVLTDTFDSMNVRLGTFFHLKCSQTPESWLKFSSVNIINECIKYLRNEDISSAVIIFARHQKTFRSSMTEELCLSLLTAVPSHVDFNALIYWLRVYIPGLLTWHPFLVNCVVEWLTIKIRTLELYGEDGPELSLKLSKELLEIIRPLLIDQSDIPIVMDINSFNQLPLLISTLEKLVYLKATHKITISFAHLISKNSKDDCLNVLYYLFDSVPYEGISFLIKDFIILFCSENYSLRSDEVIFNYIKKSFGEINWWSCENFLWELRGISFINCIQNLKEKIEAVIFFLSHVSVPWSNEVSILAEETINLKHPLVKDVISQKNNSIKKIILKKYNLCINVDHSNTRGILKYILSQNQEDVMDDAKLYVTAEGPRFKTLPYELYLYQCLENGCLKKAFSFIVKDLSLEEQIYLVRILMNYLKFRAEHRFMEVAPEFKKEWIIEFSSFANPIYDGSHQELMIIRASLFLETTYGIKARPSKLLCKSSKLNIVRKTVEQVLSGFSENWKSVLQPSKEVVSLIDEGKTISFNLDISEIEVIFEIIRQASSLNLLMTAAELIGYLSHCEGINDFSKESFDLIVNLLRMYNPQDIKHRCLIQSSRSLIESSIDCSIVDSVKVIQLKDILDILYKPSNPPPDWTGQYHDTVTNPLPSITKEFLRALVSVSGLKPSFEFFENADKVEKEDSTAENSSLCSITNNQSLYVQFCDYLRNLPIELHSYTSASKVYWFLFSLSLLQKKEARKCMSLIFQSLSSILMRVVSARKFDLNLAMWLVHLFQKDHATIWLHNVSAGNTDMKRIMNVAQLGTVYCQFHGLREQAAMYSKIYKKSVWVRRVHKYGLSSSVDSFDDEDKKEELLLGLMRVSNMELSILNQFCCDMQYDRQRCLLLYLEHLLLSWKLKFVTVNIGKDKELKVENDVQQLEDACWKVAVDIQDKTDIVNHIRLKVWEKVSKYHYEVFFVMISILERLLPEIGSNNSVSYINQKLLLNFLKTYNRVGPSPNELEMEMWSTYGFESEELFSIAQYRLPFFYVENDAKLDKFLKSEFTLDTYKKWFVLRTWFDIPLNRDLICLHSIHNLKKEVVKTGWDLQMKNKDLLQEIDECISEMGNLEMSTMAFYFVVNHVLSPGVDQLDAIQRCQLNALKWSQIDKSENCQKSLKRVMGKYLSVSTTHLLYKYKLAKPEYLAIILQPDNLISALYHDSSIVESFLGLTKDPCINELVERICKIHSTSSIRDLRMELVMRWLLSEPSNQSFLDETLVPHQAPSSMLNENLMRVCYMMKGENINKAGSLLIGFVFGRGHEDTSKPTLLRLRALICLMDITTPDQLISITGRDYISLKKHLEVLQILYGLELVGLYFTDATFEAMSKEELVTILLQNNSREAVSVTAKICVSYTICHPNTWTTILNNMISLKMIDILEKYLLEINEFVHYLERDVVLKAWKAILFYNLNKAEGDSSPKVSDKCLYLLDVCPVLKELDFGDINFRITNPRLKEKIMMFNQK